MPCYSPINAYIGREFNPSGKKSIVFSLRDAFCTPTGRTFPVELPCGQCIGCRLERSRQWAVRCVHEASMYENNCFITLTFREDFIDKSHSLVKSDFQKFMKRLRKRYPNDKIRYFHCGEYGEVCEVCKKSRHYCVCDRFVPGIGRPHHHACIFNFDFKDKYLWTVRKGVSLYRSDSLEKLWSDPDTKESFGYATIGDVTFDSAAYVARYCVKKITGDKAETHYKGREPEYVTMSRRPGVGRLWIDTYISDVYPHDEVFIRKGLKCKPPRYYDSIYDLHCQDKSGILDVSMKDIKHKREVSARNNPDNRTSRLVAREKVCRAQLKRKERTYETECL